MEPFESCIRMRIQPSEEEFQRIRAHFKPRQIKAGKKLVTPSRKNTSLIFLEKGCLRVFFKSGEKDISGLFVFEDNFFRDLSSLIPEFELAMYVEALEDTDYLSINKTDLNQLVKEVPLFETFLNKCREQMVMNLIITIISRQTQNANQRYQKLLEHPKLLQRVPLKYLASYLGITVTSFSRLRAKK